MPKPNIASKLKNLARELKEEGASTGVKKVGDAVKNSEVKKKPLNTEKVSGRKN